MTTTEKVQPRLKARYVDEIRDALNKEFAYANVMQIPGVVKVVVNMGVGDAARDAKLINGAVNDLALITGQKPEIRKARKSIAQFKLREGMPIGAKVTVRGDRMWEFLDRLLSIALPRIRDFRGLDGRKLDGHGTAGQAVHEDHLARTGGVVGREGQEGRRGQGRRRPDRQADPSLGRVLHQVRRERRRDPEERRGAPRHPYLRPGRP